MRTIAKCLPLVLLTGCIVSEGGFVPMQNQNHTQIGNMDFKVVNQGVRGEASCFYLFGLIPFGDPGLSTQAMDAVTKAADLTGKSRGLMNLAYDQYGRFLIIGSRQTARIRADVVEFGKK